MNLKSYYDRECIRGEKRVRDSFKGITSWRRLWGVFGFGFIEGVAPRKFYFNITNRRRTNKFPDFPINSFPAKSATQSCRISSRNSRINNFPCCVYDAFRVFPSPFIPKFSLFTQIRENIFLHERQREISLLPDIFSYSMFTIVKILCFNFFWQFFSRVREFFAASPLNAKWMNELCINFERAARMSLHTTLLTKSLVALKNEEGKWTLSGCSCHLIRKSFCRGACEWCWGFGWGLR